MLTVSVGIQRKLDELGRLVLPIELRRVLGIKEGDKITISRHGNQILLEKFEEADCFTGELSDDLIDFKGKKIAKSTIVELAALAGLTAQEEN